MDRSIIMETTTSNNNKEVVDDEEKKKTKGYVHVYTGNGKGKTTAAFGLAVRAVMAGKKVFIGQFVKSMKYNETKLEHFFEEEGQLRIRQYGNGCFVYGRAPTQKDIDMAVEGLAECERALGNNDDDDNNYDYDVVILDEVTIALSYKLLTVEDVVRVINQRNPKTEVVVTGRYAPDELIEIGDVVTEMKPIKHYFETQGVQARDGIER